MDVAYYSQQYSGYVITRHNDVKFALKNHAIFSSAKGNLIRESPHRFNRTLGASDNPTHELLKNIVKEAYSKQNIDRVVNSFIEHSTSLLKSNSTIPMSRIVEEASAWACTEILNLPYDKIEVQKLVLGILRYAKQSVDSNIDQTYYNNFTKLVVDLISNNVQPQGPGIYQEFMSNSRTKSEFSLFTGPTISGAGSLSGALGFLTVDIYRENLFESLQDRSIIKDVVNESLRWNCSSGRKVRTVIQPVTLHNVNLKYGDKVILSLEAANRDPSIFPDPDKFILGREDSGNLAYGYGIHACISSIISRELMNSWVGILLDTLGKYKVTTDEFVFLKTSSGNQDAITNLVVETV